MIEMKNLELNLIVKTVIFSILLIGLVACSKQDDDMGPGGNDDDPPVQFDPDNVSGEVSGIWGPNATYTIKGDVVIPEGESLEIREGVTIIVDGDGGQGTSPEINVRGSLYCYGTEDARIIFTVPEERRTVDNIFAGLWGGIIGTRTTQDMVFEYTDIEFTGALGEAGNSIVAEGEIDEGEPRYAIYFVNPEGNFIMWHSRIAYSKDDAIRMNGAKTLIAFSVFEFIGENGGEGLNAKRGTVGDMAYNLFYSVATNGLKAANTRAEGPQIDNYYYNNTFVNCGWRRAQSGRGGSLNYEAGARGICYNNLVVNSRYGLRLVPPDREPDLANMEYGYQFYYGDEQEIVDQFHPSNGLIDFPNPSVGLPIPESDVYSEIPGENDPLFVNYDLGGSYDISAARNGSDVNFRSAAQDFHLQAGSPALTGAFTGFQPRFESYTVNGRTYTTPLPSEFFGAFGTR
ncbi:MAG: hypothetical protein EA362_00650 [Saprospirales bacterium]|nr:MAG: hypothetical protein EA362_00650 [Saprospirales bacterium]